MSENETPTEAKEAAPQPPAPYHIFIAYVVAGKHYSQVLDTYVEDIDSAENYSAILGALTRAHGNRRVAILNWRSL